MYAVHFMDDRFVNLGEYKAGCAQRLFLKKKKGSIPTLLWQSGASESVTVSMFKYLLLTVQMWSYAQCRVTRCVCVCERERQGHITVESAVLTLACVLQTHTSIITVSVTWLCPPFRLELMVKLTTLLTVFIFTLKAEAHDYGKGRYISDVCLWCSANHNALCQLANQSRLCLLEGWAL